MTTETQELEVAEAATAPILSAAPVSFWHRPNIERYFVPFALPLMVVGGLIAFVLSMSRIFLSGHGNVPVIIGSAITVVIMIGGVIASAAPKMRSGSVALLGGGFVMVILFGGWLSLGNSELKSEGEALAPEGPALGVMKFQSTNGLKFVPPTAEATTGIYTIELDNGGGAHTFEFDIATTEFPGLAVSAAGDIAAARAFFGEEGEYTFYCSVSGHRAAGMEGTITVTGEPKTLAAAVAELPAEEPPA